MNENKSNRLYTFCLLLFCFAIITNTAAQSVRISGSVFSNGQQPLEGAIITIHPAKLTTLTDKKGGFYLNQIPTNTQKLTVRYSGFTLYEMNLSLNENSNVLPGIFLKPEVKQIKTRFEIFLAKFF